MALSIRPWGIALAPADFGPMSNAILINNNTSRGRVNAFNPKTGQFVGPLRDANGKVIEVDEIWALQFGQDGGPNCFFFSSRRRHTRSVSAFLLNRSSDLERFRSNTASN